MLIWQSVAVVAGMILARCGPKGSRGESPTGSCGDVGPRSMIEGRGLWDSGGVGKERRRWAIGGQKLTLPRLRCRKGCNFAPHRDKTMSKKQEGRKHDRRQQLVGYLKRFLRKPWFMRLVIGVIWKLMDRYL